MSFRDDLGASQARNRQLEEELQEARQVIAELRRERDARGKDQKRRERDEDRAPLRRRGKIVFKAPPRYFPLLKLWPRAALVSFQNPPRTGHYETSVFALLVLYKLLYWPLVNLIWRPLYFIFLIFPVLPVAAAVLLVGSLLLAPFIFISRFRISDDGTDPFHDSPWTKGKFTDGQAGTFLWILLSCCMQPLLPLYLKLMDLD